MTTLRLLRFVVLPLLAVPGVLRAQAAVEYALKSAGSAGAASGASAIAGCKVDSALLSCLSHSYPRTTTVVAVLICLMIVRWLAIHARYRAH
jgi:hypothetical protein